MALVAARSKRSGEKRAAILEAAREEFLEQGFGRASMDRISARAQVSKRTTYNHFESKEKLFQETVLLLCRKDDLPVPTYRPTLALEDQLREIGQVFLDHFRDEHQLALSRMIMGEVLHHPGLMAGLQREDFEKRLVGLTAWIREAREGGRLRVEDPERAAEQFSSLLSGPVFWGRVFYVVEEFSSGELETILDETIALFLARYRA